MARGIFAIQLGFKLYCKICTFPVNTKNIVFLVLKCILSLFRDLLLNKNWFNDGVKYISHVCLAAARSVALKKKIRMDDLGPS